MLFTNLKHLETDQDVSDALRKNKNLMVSYVRMGPMCLPVYAIMEELESIYTHVTFRDQDFDIPAANFIRNLPECSSFMELPFDVYFKNGKVVAARTSIQNKNQIVEILDREFGRPS
jgi:thioredoxin 1